MAKDIKHRIGYHCPNCGYDQHCPCKSCKFKLPWFKKPWRWVEGNWIACGKCGFTKSADWWEDLEYAIYDGWKNKK